MTNGTYRGGELPDAVLPLLNLFHPFVAGGSLFVVGSLCVIASTTTQPPILDLLGGLFGTAWAKLVIHSHGLLPCPGQALRYLVRKWAVYGVQFLCNQDLSGSGATCCTAHMRNQVCAKVNDHRAITERDRSM